MLVDAGPTADLDEAGRRAGRLDHATRADADDRRRSPHGRARLHRREVEHQLVRRHHMAEAHRSRVVSSGRAQRSTDTDEASGQGVRNTPRAEPKKTSCMSSRRSQRMRAAAEARAATTSPDPRARQKVHRPGPSDSRMIQHRNAHACRAHPSSAAHSAPDRISSAFGHPKRATRRPCASEQNS